MNSSSKILYGSFPRTVASAKDGTLTQGFVHSEDEFDLFFNEMRPKRSLYSSICRFREDMRPVLDKVVFDFDSPMKESVFSEDTTDREKIGKMRMDDELADKVLGLVWSDAQKLVKKCLEENIPVITVFSGLGIHCHLLYQDKVSPVKEKVTTSNYFIEECGLETYDRKIIPDTRRVLRIPNSQRISDGEPTSTWCIPLTEKEVLHNDVQGLLERSALPKTIPRHSRYLKKNRPEIEVKEEYEEAEEIKNSRNVEMRGDISQAVPENVEMIVRECIPLPCIRERFLRPNPHHMVRFNGAVFLYQSGFTPKEVREIIRQIGWIDYDASITKKMTDQIWERGYSESSCKTLKDLLGLCVFGPESEEFSSDPKDCETYNWTSGECLWKK